MKKYIFPSIKLTFLLILLCSLLYPVFISMVAKMAPGRGEGEKVELNGKIVGYKNVGQFFTEDRYFWGRPSAVQYNAAGSGGSNKGPSNPDYLKTVQARIDYFLQHNPSVKKEDIPAEMVTASGSGLDPHISPVAAKVQVARVAAARSIDLQKLQQLIDTQTEKPLLGMLGPSKINVLQLNIALDKLK